MKTSIPLTHQTWCVPWDGSSLHPPTAKPEIQGVLGISVELWHHCSWDLASASSLPTPPASQGSGHRFGEALAAGRAVPRSKVGADGF